MTVATMHVISPEAQQRIYMQIQVAKPDKSRAEIERIKEFVGEKCLPSRNAHKTDLQVQIKSKVSHGFKEMLHALCSAQ